ncbi:MAG: hypothetical protein RLZ63_349 [Pseudomonadota bacterium]
MSEVIVQSVWLIWFLLAGCLGIIGYAGYKLCHYGDAIAQLSGLSRSWVGLVLLATVTSLPELVSGLSAVTVAQVPDIAVGSVMGSCVFNLLLIVVLDVLYRKESIFTRARLGNVVAAGYSIALIGFVGFNLLIYRDASVPALGHVGWYTPLLVLLYALALRSLYRYELQQVPVSDSDSQVQQTRWTLAQALGRYLLAALAVVLAALLLPFVGDALARAMQWEQSFVGTLFVAVITSAPEVAVTVAALRMGSVDMAIGNLFGSNLFNMAILAVDDLAYLPGPLFADVSIVHSVSAFSAMMMSGVAVVGLILRPVSKAFRTLSWTSLLLFAIYILNTLFIYLHDH